MDREGLAVVTSETVEAIIQPDGSINESLLADQYGLGVEEASQEVTFGTYSGSVAQMLSDERCPVGGMVREAYKENGIEGVQEKFKTLSTLDSRFSVNVTETTLAREHEKKN